MKITIWQYTWYLIATMYSEDDSKAIMFSKTKSWSWMIWMVTVNLWYVPYPNQIILEQDTMWEWITIYDALKWEWLIEERFTTLQSWFNTYKVVTLTYKWMKLFEKESTQDKPKYIKNRLPVVINTIQNEYLWWYICWTTYVLSTEYFDREKEAKKYAEWSSSSEEA